ARYPARGPRFDSGTQSRQGFFHPQVQAIKDGTADYVIHVGCGHRERVVDVAGNRIKTCEGGDVWIRLRRRMESGEALGRAFDLCAFDLAAAQTPQYRRLLRQTLHLHRPFERFALAAEAKALALPRHRHDAPINSRSEAAIETHFLGAEMPARLQ